MIQTCKIYYNNINYTKESIRNKTPEFKNKEPFPF